MLKFLGIILLVFIFFALLGVMLFTSAIMSFIAKIKEMMRQNNEKDRDYTGRQRQQYAYRNRANTANSRNQQQQWRQSSSSAEDETVIDTRSRSHSNKKIFDDNEGEYVDFVEE